MGILNIIKKQNKIALILLVLIILLAAYLRLYRISDYMTFLGDEGRDVLVARGILEGHFTLLGPRSSAGDFFMGPAYYYMITPFLWLFNFDPVGPAIMVGLLSILTTWLIYFVGKRWFNEKAGFLAAALYAVSPVVINYSHSSWNPDVLPFFALLTIYFLYKSVNVKSSWKYLIVVGFLLGIDLQLHYLSVLLGVVTACYLIWNSWYKDRKIKYSLIVKSYSQVLLGFIVGLSPFLLFELRHNFANTRSIFGFIFGDTLQKTYSSNMSYWGIVSDAFFRIFARLVFYFPSPDLASLFDKQILHIFAWTAMLITFAAIYFVFRMKNKYVLVLISLWLFLSLALLGLYKKSIYDYLFTFIFPLPFLIIGNFLSSLMSFGKSKKKIVLTVVGVLIFISIFLYNLKGLPFQYVPNRQKDQARIISEAVVKMSDNKPYNFALISKGNSDHAYRYYLDVLGHSPIQIENPALDPQKKTITNQLLVVCEDPNCQPLGNSLFDVATFGRASIAAEQDVIVVKIFKLVHYEEGKTK